MNLPTNHTNCWLHCTLFISSWWGWEHLYVFVSFQFYNQHFHSFLLTSLSHFSKVGIKPLKPDRLSLPTLTSSPRSFSSIFSLSPVSTEVMGSLLNLELPRAAWRVLDLKRVLSLGRLDPYLALGVGGWHQMGEEWDSRPEFGFSPQSEISASLGLEQGESCTCEKKEKKGGGWGWGWRSTAGRPAHKSIIHPNPQCSQFSFQPKSSPKLPKLTYLRMLNVWGGIHRRGGRPRRGGGAAVGSSGQTLLSCRCNRPELEDWKFGLTVFGLPQFLYHSGKGRLFGIGQRQNRLNYLTSTCK